MSAARIREPLLGAVSGLAVAVWLGGLVVLGAVVAPTVFRNVPAPYSADAMTLVFRRFDRVALAAAGIAFVAEAFRSRAPARGRGLALGLLVVAAGLAVAEALHFSPTIEALHRAGAVRGVGAAGAELDAVHHWAERLAKGELAALVGFVIARVNASWRASSNPVDPSLPPPA